MTKNPPFENRIFMEGGASEADISTARAGVHSRNLGSEVRTGELLDGCGSVVLGRIIDGTCAGRAPPFPSA
jgi:hypothetical protein